MADSLKVTHESPKDARHATRRDHLYIASFSAVYLQTFVTTIIQQETSSMDFVLQHKGQLAIVTALVVYSATKNKLTPGGIAAAIVTAGIHMIHPWGVFFNLLVGFFVAGTVGTKVRTP